MKDFKTIYILAFIACQLLGSTLYSQVTKILDGKWTNVSCGDTSYSGVSVNVTSGTGVITNKATSPFDNGQMIWVAIVKNGTGEFECQGLGNDGRYYTIRIIRQGNQLVSIAPTQVGGIQMWEGESVGSTPENSVAGNSFGTLEGEWVRISGNNPANNGMKVKVSGSAGRVTVPKSVSFSVGSIKWKGITKQNNGFYTHNELGSDGNYYDANIQFLSRDTLDITVFHNGLGSHQIWARSKTSASQVPNIIIDPSKDITKVVNPNSTVIPRTPNIVEIAYNPEEVPCNISKPTRLTNGPGLVDYVVKCVVDITSRLDIEPGTIIEFEENAGFGIYDAGILNVVGTESKPITLRGKESIKGYWRGIHIETKSVSNVLEYVNIADAGSNYVYCCNEKASLFIKGAKLQLKNVSISNGGDFGIVAKNNAELPVFKNMTVTGHNGAPIRIDANLAHYVGKVNSGTDVSDYSGNVKNYILLAKKEINTPSIWESHNVPYLIDDVLNVTDFLSLKPGTTIQFDNEAGLGVYDSGALEAKGTDANPIIFEGLRNSSGFWRGIHIETKDDRNRLQNVAIRDAGGNYVYCCNPKASLFLKGARVALSNISIENGENDGLVAIQKENDFVQYQNVSITGHKGYPLHLDATLYNLLDGTQSSYSGNVKKYALVAGRVTVPTTWKNLNIPYEIDDVMDVTQPFELEAGVSIEFGENAGIGVYDNGSFKTNGTASNLVVLKGKQDLQGYWRGIHLETNSLSNNVQHTMILNAGTNYVYCCNEKAGVFLKDGQLTIENSIISKSGGYGIYARRRANLMEGNNVFANNQSGNIERN